jgi:hypothetical protein
MRHLALLLVVGCGTSGEPIKGDISINYGADKPKFEVGSAVLDKNTAGQMLVQIGTDNVDCDTYLDNFLSFSNPKGTFVYFSVDKATPGMHDGADVSVMKSTGNDTSINSTSGKVVIDTIGARVTGSVMFTTTDEKIGAIAVMGGFDVKACF